MARKKRRHSSLFLARTARNLTRIELAAASGLTREWVRRLEIQDARPSLDAARRLAYALGTTVDVLWPPQESGR